MVASQHSASSHAAPPASSVDPSGHRAWPLPNRKHVMRMGWHDLAFFHWRVDANELRRTLPAGLELDLFDGEAWIGVVPFRMTGVAPRLLPDLPWLSAFPELNVRTYVTCEGKPGVWFHSLDATNPVAVRTARWTYNLKYMDARIDFRDDGDWIHYDSQRTHRGEPAADLKCRYRATSDGYSTQSGTLEHWLTSRYCLYAANRRGQIYRGEIDHPPWQLQKGETEIEKNTMTDGIGVRLPDESPLVHFARTIDVVAWSLDKVNP